MNGTLLESAQRNAPEASVEEQVKYRQETVTDIPFPDNIFNSLFVLPS